MSNRTFTIIKPDSVRKGNFGKIISRLEAEGFRILSLKKVNLSTKQAEAFYGVHRERPFDVIYSHYLEPYGVAAYLGGFADSVVVAEGGAIPVPRDVPFDALATLGCAVLTGVGAVTNAGRVPPGSRVVVIGAGGVGLNVVQGARIAGCEQIIAIDRRPTPLALSQAFGATHSLQASDEVEVAKAVRELTAGRGADFVFDTVGSPATLATALACARKGGAVVLTGLSRADSHGTIAMFPFVMQEKRLIGSVYGSGQPARDIPRLVSLYQEGRLKLSELVSRTYTLDKVNDALTALAAGDGARGVIRW